ncbi:DUF4395 domain-containing protein [Demequina flava]|uniref:DUF4395 domain-containing protein n=1 Tax=Demequina flava TaxID=1095025 RepID=UPI0007831990|nr:DUF4395 domain-containing protein [Demequina flava]
MSDANSRPVIGTFVAGIDTPVINERAVRASAGILFLLGFPAWFYGAITGDLQFMRLFGILFASEMMLRLFVGTSYTPSLWLGSLLTRRQRPEWVDAHPKQLAWSIGLGMGMAGCLALGWLGLPAAIAQAICAACLTLLHVEAAFGVCVGCALSQRFSRHKPQRCSGDTCNYTPPTHR